MFVQKAFLHGLFLGELIFRGAYYWKEFCISKWVRLDNKNSLKHYENSLKQLKTASANSPWAYIREGLLSEGFLRLRFGGLIFREGLFLGGLIIGILWYLGFESSTKVVCQSPFKDLLVQCCPTSVVAVETTSLHSSYSVIFRNPFCHSTEK